MRVAAVVVVLAVVLPTPARAFEEFEGTRAQAMGGATRAWAVGESGLLLNPSGMSLVKSYNVEASYAYTSRLQGQFLHASVVDSTSAANIAGGIYYTYRLDERAGVEGRAHEAGGALSLPLGNYLAIGATLKWFKLIGADQGPAPVTGGVTFDGGLTVRPTPILSLAFVASNLRDLKTGLAPRTLGYGVAILPIPDLVLAVDGVTIVTPGDMLGFKGTGVRGGGEWSIAQRVAIRLGGGTDPMLGVGYLAGGFSLVSDIGAFDVSARGDLFPMKTGSEKNWFVGVGLRLFVSGAMESAAAQP